MTVAEGEVSASPFVPLTVTVRCWDTADSLISNIASALKRPLPELIPQEPHDRRMVIVATAPSVERYTIERQPGDMICCVNGAHDWLLARGVVPDICVLLDSTHELADVVHPVKGVRYVVASQCHPDVFDALSGFHVIRWHALVPPETLGGRELVDVLEEHAPPGDGNYWMIPGGGTAAIRCLSLGQFSGYRKFLVYGLDSSFADDGRRQVQAHMPCKGNEIEVEFNGRRFRTTPSLAAQAQDFQGLYLRALNDCRVTVMGDGLIPWMCESLNRLKFGPHHKETT